MSLRWIHENQEAPICDEESSDIDNSSCDDSDDTTDHLTQDEEDVTANPGDKSAADHQHRRQKRETFRHPTTTVSIKNIRKDALTKDYDPNVNPNGNPSYGSVMQLHSMTGFRLAILPCGKIHGFDCGNNPFAMLRISSPSIGIVQIQGTETGRYLAFNARGQLYGEKNKDKDNTTWKHLLIGSYDCYLSEKYADRGWYVGIKKNGRPKNGTKTAPNQKATKFLPIRES